MTPGERRWLWLMEAAAKYWGCHQMPERSFFFFGYQCPVCARCLGIILGELLSIPLWFLVPPSALSSFLFLLPMAADGIIQYKTSYTSTNFRRVTSGTLFGIGFFTLLFHGITALFQ